MRVIVTPTQVEFKTSYYSIILDKKSNLKIDLLFKRAGNLSFTKAENITDLNNLITFNKYDIRLNIHADKRSVNFYGGLASRLYYYFRMDGLLEYYLLDTPYRSLSGTDIRTIIVGADKVKEVLSDLKKNGYEVSMELTGIEPFLRQQRNEQRAILKFIENLSFIRMIGYFILIFIVLFILLGIVYYILPTGYSSLFIS